MALFAWLFDFSCGIFLTNIHFSLFLNLHVMRLTSHSDISGFYTCEISHLSTVDKSKL